MEELERVFGLGVGDIAQLCGVSSSAVSQWFGRGGRSTQKIDNVRAAVALERRTGWNALWIAYGDEPKVLPKAALNPVESEEPVQALPSIGTTIVQMAAVLASLDEMSRESIEPLILRAIRNPDVARDAARTADAIAQSQRLRVSDPAAGASFGRAQANPVETGFSPLEPNR
nr:hypothetical protein [Variovorax boronicumulans]